MPGVFKAGGANGCRWPDYVAAVRSPPPWIRERGGEAGKTYMESQYKNRNTPMPEIAVFTKYEELLASADIDAVVISLPDHQHAQICLAAIRAGKDVYMQKPFTMTHEEGVMLRDAIVKSGRTFQVGSQRCRSVDGR